MTFFSDKIDIIPNETWVKHSESKIQIYLVSNFGRYQSISKYTGRTKVVNNNSREGYVRVRNLLLHRMVAEAFIPNPDNKEVVNHINGIKSDNRVENLEWVTYSENAIHAEKIGLNGYRKDPKYLKHMSEINRGSNNPMYGKKYSHRDKTPVHFYNSVENKSVLTTKWYARKHHKQLFNIASRTSIKDLITNKIKKSKGWVIV